MHLLLQDDKIKRVARDVCVSILLFPPPIMDQFKLFQVICLVSAALITARLVYQQLRRKKQLNVQEGAAILLLLIFWFSIFIPDVAAGDVHGGVILYLGRLLLFCSLMKGKTETELIGLCRVLAMYVFALIVLNFFFLVALPEGIIPPGEASWQRQDILLNVNSYTFYYVFAYGVASVGFRNDKRMPLIVLSLFAVEAASLLAHGKDTSETGVILLVATFISYVGRGFINRRSQATINRVVVVLAAATFTLVIVLGSWKWISELLAAAGLGSNTLTSRMEIWGNALDQIKSRGLRWGSGTGVAKFTIGDGGMPRSAHNMYLQILYYGGIIALVAYTSLLSFPLLEKPRHLSEDVWVTVCSCILLYVVLFFVEQNVLFEGPLYLVLMVLLKPKQAPTNKECIC